ncbi:MAG: hypothetical protein O7A68_07295 [Alphaproteobacteria bacterium]|nr:hypothetical protein [Alphaproteobacteria bacterium]
MLEAVLDGLRHGPLDVVEVGLGAALAPAEPSGKASPAISLIALMASAWALRWAPSETSPLTTAAIARRWPVRAFIKSMR